MGSGRPQTRRSWQGKSSQSGETTLWNDFGNKTIIITYTSTQVLIELKHGTEYGRASYARADAQGLQPRSFLGHGAYVYSRLTFANYCPKWQVRQLVRLMHEASCSRLKGPLPLLIGPTVTVASPFGPLQLGNAFDTASLASLGSLLSIRSLGSETR